MKKGIFIICLFTTIGCKQSGEPKINPESPEANYPIISKNVKQYLLAHLKDAVSIDSLVYYSDSLTQKKIKWDQYTINLGNSLAWQWYKPGQYDDLLNIPTYTEVEAKNQEEHYKKESDKYLSESKTSDSVKLIAWHIIVDGLFTQNDASQKEYSGDMYLTLHDFKIIDPKELFGDLFYPASNYYPYKVSVSSYNPAKGLSLFDTSYLDVSDTTIFNDVDTTISPSF